MWALLWLLAGCPPAADSETDSDTDAVDTDVEDTDLDDTDAWVPFGWTDADLTCDGIWSETEVPGYDRAGACGWGFVWAEGEDALLQLTLQLPDVDFGGGNDVAYSLSVGADAVLMVLEQDDGPDNTSFNTCSDASVLRDGTLALGVSGTAEIEARYLCALDADPVCGDEDHEYHAVVRLLGVVLERGDESYDAWDDVTLRVTLGTDDCGS